MSNPAKAKGTAHETAIVRHLQAGGIPARRVAQTGAVDTGDIHGVSPFVIQAKAWRDIPSALREGVDGARRQASAAGESFGVAVVKRPRRPVGDSYVVMSLDDFARLLVELRPGTQPTA